MFHTAVTGLIRGGQHLRTSVNIGSGRGRLALEALEMVSRAETLEEIAFLEEEGVIHAITPQYYDSVFSDAIRDAVPADLIVSLEVIDIDGCGPHCSRGHKDNLARQEGEAEPSDIYRRARSEDGDEYHPLTRRFRRWKRHAMRHHDRR